MSTSLDATALKQLVRRSIPDALVTYLAMCREMDTCARLNQVPALWKLGELQRARDSLKEHGFTPAILDAIADHVDETYRLIVADVMPPRNSGTSSKASVEAA